MVSSTTVSLNIFAFNVLFCKGLVRWHYRHIDNMQGQRRQCPPRLWLYNLLTFLYFCHIFNN